MIKFLVIVSFFSTHAAGQIIASAASDSGNDAVAPRTRELLRKGTPEQVQQLQAELTNRLAAAATPSEIRLTCIDLAAAPTDGAILILLGRLQQPAKPEMLTAMCHGLASLLQARLPVSNVTRQSAAQVLWALAVSPESRSRTVQAAMVAMAAMRGSGLDMLLALRKQRSKTVDGFYSCLAATKDVRALPELRSAFVEPSTTLGHRIEIINAMGQLFAAARMDQAPVDLSERSACAAIVHAVLVDAAADEQLRGVALRTLAQISPQDARARIVLQQSLLAAAQEMREAALEALFTEENQSDPETLRLVQVLANHDQREEIRELARAVLCKNDSEACVYVE
jgi:hypothetical protein